MILDFKTKRDANGNTYYISIDTEKRVYSCDYNRFSTPDGCMTITKSDRRALAEKCESAGFVRLDRL